MARIRAQLVQSSRQLPFVERHRAPAVGLPEMIERQVHDDAVQPGEELRASVEAADGAIGAEKGVLRQVVGIRVVADDAKRSRVHTPLVATHERLESLAVTAASAANLVGVRRHQ